MSTEKLYEALYIKTSTLTYATTKSDEMKLKRFERNILRKIHVTQQCLETPQKYRERMHGWKTYIYIIREKEDILQYTKGIHKCDGRAWRADLTKEEIMTLDREDTCKGKTAKKMDGQHECELWNAAITQEAETD